MKIQENDYSVEFNEAEKNITFSGTIRLQGVQQYEPIKEVLHQGLARTPAGETLTLDFRGLKFLNSSGITTISMFVIQMRNAGDKSLKVLGTKEVSWQEKSLHNLNKLWNQVEVEISG